MKSPLKNQKGAVLIFELIVLAAVLVAAGFAAYMYPAHRKSASPAVKPKPHVAIKSPSPSATPTPTPTPDPYAGWKSYTLKNEKISFKYPSGWNLSDKTSSANNSYDARGLLIYTPGSDIVTLTCSDSLTLGIGTAPSSYDAGGPHAVLNSSPIGLLGSTYYLNFVSITGSPGNTTNGGFYLVNHAADTAESTSSFPLSKNISIGPGAKNNPAIQDTPAPYNLISIYYAQPVNNNYPLSKYQQDPNFKVAEQILESMKY